MAIAMKPNPEAPRTADLNTPAEFEEAHRALSNHAFSCHAKFEDTYRQCRNEGHSPFSAYTWAVKAHDHAVRWTYENVGLD